MNVDSYKEFFESSRYKVPPLNDLATVIAIVDGKQTETTFRLANDGEFWWTVDGKEVWPSHYSLWGFKFPHNLNN